MSNAMSRSKSRWKGALLATVAGAVVSPIAAKASMTVGTFFAPIGSTGFQTTKYITPDQTGTAIPVYVYATVTGTGAVSANPSNGGAVQITSGNFDGLQYLYYNLNATGGAGNGITGGITSETLNATLGFNSGTSDPSSNASYGTASQAGTIQLTAGSNLAAGTTVVAVGSPAALNASTAVSSSAMTDFAKPRAGAPVWSNYATNTGSGYTYYNDGTNIIIGNGSNGLATNQVAFLVETFAYTPTVFTPSGSSTNSIAFSIGAPYNSNGGSILSGVNYAPANSFNDSSSSVVITNSSGSSIAAITSANYSSGHVATLIDTVPGDAFSRGTTTFADLNNVLTHFNAVDTSWADGNYLYYQNNSDTVINFSDINVVLTNFNATAGGAPSELPADAALLADPQAVALLESYGITPVAAVPEPASLGLLGVLGVSALTRRRKTP